MAEPLRGFAGFEAALVKAKGAPSGGGVTTRDVSDIVNALAGALDRTRKRSLDNATGFGGVPLPRPQAWRTSEFGPDWPLIGEPLDPARRDTGQPDPRLDQYPVSWNLQIGRDAHVPWGTLKRWSEQPLFRLAIEYRKTELATMDWQIRVDPKVATRVAQTTGKAKDQVAADLRDKHQDDIARLTDWWEVPDRKNGRDWNEWIQLAMDEQLTHDALAIYPHMTYGGDLLGLWILDGSTIMPLRDESGGRPLPPAPAWQQILYGFPRGEFTAQMLTLPDGREYTPGAMKAGQLIYRRRTPRANTPYGYSATEQALLDGLLWTKRFQWMLSEYTEGVMPAQFIESDGMLDWTPTQLLDYERDFNTRLSGQTSERFRAPFLPPGFHAAAMQTAGERYKPDYDLFLVRLVLAHFNVLASEIGFNEAGGLGSAGFHDGQEDIQFRKGRMPDLRWFATLITQISRTHLNMPSDLEFTFLGLDEEDEAAADELDHNRLADGRMVLNESRSRIGLAPYGFKEANMPMMQTARGVVFFEGASETAPPGTLIEPASEKNDIDPATGQRPAGKPGQQASAKPIKPVSNASKEAMDEIVAFNKWLVKIRNKGATRPFRFEHLAKDTAIELGIEVELATFAKAADADPKANGPDGTGTPIWSPYTGHS